MPAPTTKADVVREILQGAKEPYNYDNLLAACRARVEQLPPERRKSLEVGRHNLHQAVSKIRRDGAPAANGHTPKPPVAPPPPESFTVNELLAARRLLEVCGDSLYRAQSLVKTVAEIACKREGER